MTDLTEQEKEDLFTNINPDELPDDLKPIYKSMQADYTRKTQSIAEQRKGFEAKELDFETKLKSQGALEQEVTQWRNWYAQLEGDNPDPNKTTNDEDLTSLLDNNNDEDATAKALKLVTEQLAGLKQGLESVTSSIKDTQTQTNRMFDYQAQLQEIVAKDNEVDRNKLMQHALDNGMTDLSKAYDDLYRDKIIDAEVKVRLEKAQEEARLRGIDQPNKSFSSAIKPLTDGKTPKTFSEATAQIMQERGRQQ